MNSPEEVSNYISEAIKDRSFENVAEGGDVGNFILNDMEGVILEALQVLQERGLIISKWETIDKAKKDGSPMLLFYEGDIYKGYWYTHPSVSGWVTNDFNCADYDFEPTHFLPLPNPPKGGE